MWCRNCCGQFRGPLAISTQCRIRNVRLTRSRDAVVVNAKRGRKPKAQTAQPAPAKRKQSVPKEDAAEAEMPAADMSREIREGLDRLMHDSEWAEGFGEDLDHVVGAYTPANFISFTTTEEESCRHIIEVEVEASVEKCFSYFKDWESLVPMFDLINTIGVHENDPDICYFQLFYRFGKLPILQIVFVLRRVMMEENEQHAVIAAQAVEGMPLVVEVEMAAQKAEDGSDYTQVMFKCLHAQPTLIQEWVGKQAFQHHVHDILQENLAVFKAMAEGVVTPENIGEWFGRNRTDCSGQIDMLDDALLEAMEQEEARATT